MSFFPPRPMHLLDKCVPRLVELEFGCGVLHTMTHRVGGGMVRFMGKKRVRLSGYSG